MSTKIYHNPRCSKSRQTLELLQDKGIETEIIEYLTTHQDEIDFDAIDTLNWDYFNEELSNINAGLSQIIEIEEKLEEIVETANEINTILRREKV